jgi:hypothetical protein
VRANPPGYTFYIVGGAVVLLILVLGIVRTLRRSRSATSRTPAPAVAPPPPQEDLNVAPEGEGETVEGGDAGVASGSPVRVTGSTARRMTDDRT